MYKLSNYIHGLDFFKAKRDDIVQAEIETVLTFLKQV